MTRDAEAGLTLIEMLVVLTIIAIASGVTALGLGALDRGARVEEEARRLADRLQLASDAALASGAPMALIWDKGGYRFARWDAPGRTWGDPVARPLAEPRRFQASLALHQADGPPEGRILISPDRGQAGAALTVAGGSKSWTVRFDGLTSTASRGRSSDD